MSDEFIAVSIDGLEEIAAKLAKLPDAAGDAGVDESSKYAIEVLRKYPPQRSVSRKAAYGVTFFSAKQRRFFFAALRDGRINVPYRRTQTLRKGWRQVGTGRTSFIANETPWADLVMGAGQSRHAKKIGWKQAGAMLLERIDRLVQKFDVGVAKAIKKLGL